MIQAQTIVDRTLSILDAEGSDRYLFDQDFKPAINSAVEWLVAVFNSAFAQNKLSEEDLRELIKYKVFQANNFSRVRFNSTDVGEELWTILAVLTEVTVYPNNTPPPLPGDGTVSVYHPGYTFVSSDESAARLSIQEWNENKKNIFKAGNTIMTNKFKKYAYLNFADYSSTSYSETGEIEIRPDVSGEFVVLSYLKYPTPIDDISDEIEFPETITDLLVQKTANFISWKQGDNTSLYGVTENDINKLVSFMVA